MPKKLWEPSRELIKNSNLFKYEKFVSKNYKYNFSGKYKKLLNWSVKNPKDFWNSIVGPVNRMRQRKQMKRMTRKSSATAPPPNITWMSMMVVYNRLPQDVVDCRSVSEFQTKLTEIAKTFCQRYDPRWSICLSPRYENFDPGAPGE